MIIYGSLSTFLIASSPSFRNRSTSTTTWQSFRLTSPPSLSNTKTIYSSSDSILIVSFYLYSSLFSMLFLIFNMIALTSSLISLIATSISHFLHNTLLLTLANVYIFSLCFVYFTPQLVGSFDCACATETAYNSLYFSLDHFGFGFCWCCDWRAKVKTLLV